MKEDSGNTWTQVNDQHITGLGKIMCKIRWDELPQSINLLNGSLSLFGLRPEQVNIVENLKKIIPFYNERYIIKPGKPGITSWAQLNVYAGNVKETKLKLEYDLYYLKNRSLLFDLEIIFKTLYQIIISLKGH